ncbi:cyclin-domain-containing protein [Plenodomus tracheiphilus IPT5]|uniref:Cyclin-domain-containing protein n=1 Tax=Plenodomus tracheiphilus IPT5 TaxID=1408161 RepID=A0A6A7BLF3_9PLEO|nr:cyclin-domain-containing protein [Plenodomus tracheiphilus IPT5]
MLTSSPTISAPPSPSTAFHASAHRPYHASRRTSASSSAPSPRFAVSSAAARRLDAPQTPRPAFTAPAPAPSPSSLATTTATAPSPQSRKRSYADAGTQYTPDGLPPTHRPQHTQPGPQDGIDTACSTVDSAPLTAPAIAHTPRGDTPARPVVTEPQEPQVRVDPQPVSPAHIAQPQIRRTPKQKADSSPEQLATHKEACTVLQVPASPAKRARPEGDHNVKIMPLQYETCDVKDLGVLISDMLMELVRLNDGFPLRDGTLTRFHSRAPPGISVRDYLSRLIVHATLSPPILLSMVFYVDKLCAMYPAFTISSLTVHRFLITAATVAAKGLSDSFWTNSLYARVGGVSVRELALLELEFLQKLDWRIVPKPEVLVDYYKGLVDRGTGYAIEKESETDTSASADQAHSSNGSATGIHTKHHNP